MEETLGKFTAQRIDNGEVIEGNLIYGESSPFVYILTEETDWEFMKKYIKAIKNSGCRCCEV